MKNLIPKENKYRVLLTLLILLLISGWFYWFQYRPAQIKHDCSWVKRHQDTIPAKPGLTQEQIDKKCSQIVGNPWYKELTCKLSPVGAEQAIPAKDWWGEAMENEYKFCLHDKGL